MSVRPFIIALVVVLILVSASSALYYFGVLDSFMVEDPVTEVAGENSGPVVRNTVSDVVLPLASSERINTDEVEEPTDYSHLQVEDEPIDVTPKKIETVEKDLVVAEVPSNSTANATVALETVEKKVVPPKNNDKKVSKKVAVQAPVKKTVKTIAYGKVKDLKVSCQDDTVIIKAFLSKQPERVTWFNLSSPRKLIIDIRGQWKNYAKSIYRLKNCSVEKMVLGEQPDRLRLVLYINKSDVAAKIIPEIKKTSNSVELLIKF